jgi:N-acetylmuramic acid 6-phosphate etherase
LKKEITVREKNEIFNQLGNLSTEQRNPATMGIDRLPIGAVLKLINNEDKKVAHAVGTQIPFIEDAVRLVLKAFKKKGRLIYIGAGTSGRLGILDAAECPPTFGTPGYMIQGLIAGGRKAVFRSQEGAEDYEKNGSKEMDRLKVGSRDVVCGIAASLRTPFVAGGIKRAKQRGAKTVFITTNPRKKLESDEFSGLNGAIDIAICPEVGAEVIMGSTRMKSGTAQKLVLNMITTASMIRSGKVFENMMVDLQMTNRKLRERAKRIVMIATGVTYDEAEKNLKKTSFHVKTAIVMIKSGISSAQAKAKLKRTGGFVRLAIETGTVKKGKK